MKCNKCGCNNASDARFCDSCGNDLSNLEYIPTKTYTTSIYSFSGIISIIAGIISIVGSFKMTQIKSVSGDSIAESFYNSFGIFGIGFGLFMIGIGIYLYQRNN